MRLFATRVAPEWVDYNGHMNDAEYARVFSLGVEALMERIGLDEAGREKERYTLYTLETHLCYRREVLEGQSLDVEVSLLDRDAKRLHVFFEMRDSHGNQLATSEQMLMGMTTAADGARPASFPESVDRAISELPVAPMDAWPELAGRRIGLPPRR